MSTAEKMGTRLAQECNWDGEAILEAFVAALTEANFHDFAGRALQMQAELEES